MAQLSELERFRAADCSRTRAQQSGRQLARLIAWIRAEHPMRRHLAELRAADDRMLADIGLARGEIEYSVRHGRWGDRPDNDLHRQVSRTAGASHAGKWVIPTGISVPEFRFSTVKGTSVHCPHLDPAARLIGR